MWRMRGVSFEFLFILFFLSSCALQDYREGVFDGCLKASRNYN